MSGTEDDIFSNMEAATGDDLGGAANSNDVGANAQINQSDPAGHMNVDAPQPQQRNEQQFRQPQQQQRNGKPDQTGVPTGLFRDRQNRIVDQKGNLYDDRGQLVASAGSHRRAHEQNERLRTLNNELQAENQRLQSQRQSSGSVDASVLNGLPTKYGIHADNIEPMMQIAQQFQADPVKAVRTMIEYALARGHDLSQMITGKDVPDLQASVLQKMLDQRLGPMQRQQQSERENSERVANATRAAQQFMADHPEAEVHRGDIAGLMQEAQKRQGASFDPTQAALTALKDIRIFCFENNLDFNRSIQEQIDERNSQGGNSTRAPGRQPQVQGRGAPMPTGRGGRGNTPMNGARRQFDQNSRNGDIVAEAMAEAGIPVR